VFLRASAADWNPRRVVGVVRVRRLFSEGLAVEAEVVRGVVSEVCGRWGVCGSGSLVLSGDVSDVISAVTMIGRGEIRID